MAEEKVVLCLSHGDFHGPHGIRIYTEEYPNEYKSVALEPYSEKCLFLDPVRLLGNRQTDVLHISGGAGGRKFFADLAISCDRAKARCAMFLPMKVFSTQPRKEYDELQKLYEQARHVPEAKR